MIPISEDDIFRSKLDDRGRITIPKEIRDDWQLDHGDQLKMAIVEAGDPYECDDCGDRYPLPEVLILDGGDRVVCGNCATAEDRVI